MTDTPPPPIPPLFLCITLDPQVTSDFCSYRGRGRKCYALLHRNGSYLMGTSGPVVVSTWSDAVLAASRHSGSIIAIFHEEKIKFARSMPNGGIAWERVIYLPHEPTAQLIANAHTDVKETTDEKPKKKAARRK